MIRKGTPDDTAEVIGVWEKAVAETHHFLTDDDFRQIAGQMPGYLAAVELFVWEQEGKITGFTGVSEGKIDMLFVAERGKGIGRQLLEYAINQCGAYLLDVNEQNSRAIGFYEKYGFVATGRSATDSGGRPYPILHMRLKQTT